MCKEKPYIGWKYTIVTTTPKELKHNINKKL